MRCHICKKEMVCKKEDYHYGECGLNNVYLIDMEIFRCSCGEEIVSIPMVPELNTVIGKGLIVQKAPLSGEEIRFLRKNLGLTSKKFAKYLDINKSTVSRWESGKQVPSSTHDRLIRIVYAGIKGIDSKVLKKLIEVHFPEIDPKAKEKEAKPIEIKKLWTNSSDNFCMTTL